jgi:ubiquitin carboxyl-terminal hydrolase 4/11/15
MVKELEMDEIPLPEEQARLYHAFRSIRMATDQTWYLIHQQWFNTWSTSIGITTDHSTATATTTDIPPIDNSDLLDLDNNQLRFGISIGIDCEIIPEEFWNLLVKWYGLKQPTHAIPRSVIAPSGPSSESVEFYPPCFTFHLLLPSLNLEELESEQQYDLNLIRELPKVVIQKRFSIGNSIGDLKRDLTSNLFPAGLLTRSLKLWSIHSPPSNPNQLILSVAEFGNLETQLVEPSSGDAADLNEALLTDPVNVLAIEQQDPEGHWLINPKSAPPSTPPQLQEDDPTSSGPVFGGQEWLDRMEKMNQANLLDPKFSITSPNSDLSLVASVLPPPPPPSPYISNPDRLLSLL